MSDKARRARELDAAATPGPWDFEATMTGHVFRDPKHRPFVSVHVGHPDFPGNTAFIAESRTLLVELAAEVEALEGETACDVCGGSGVALSGSCGCGGTGKLHDLANTARKELFRTIPERDAALAEVEQLKARVALDHESVMHTGRLLLAAQAERDAARAEVERLKLRIRELEAVTDYDGTEHLLRETEQEERRLEAEVERLKAAVRAVADDLFVALATELSPAVGEVLNTFACALDAALEKP